MEGAAGRGTASASMLIPRRRPRPGHRRRTRSASRATARPTSWSVSIRRTSLPVTTSSARGVRVDHDQDAARRRDERRRGAARRTRGRRPRRADEDRELEAGDLLGRADRLVEGDLLGRRELAGLGHHVPEASPVSTGASGSSASVGRPDGSSSAVPVAAAEPLVVGVAAGRARPTRRGPPRQVDRRSDQR